MESLIDAGRKITLWLSSRPNRLRLRGARIEVMAFVVSRRPEFSILLGQSPYHNLWMPPQEGVKIGETFVQALHRCLEIECGLDLPSDSKTLDRTFHLRSVRFMGILNLPPGRHGERPVSDDSAGTPLESVVLKRKAYWMATVILDSQSAIKPKADGKELLRLRWFNFKEAESAIKRTNHEDKARLLVKCLSACASDLRGAPRS